MAARKAPRTDRLEDGKATRDVVEHTEVPRAAAAMPVVVSAMRASRGAVDAPGKRHRKPPPQEPIDKRMGEPMGKQVGQKSAKNRMRSGRG